MTFGGFGGNFCRGWERSMVLGNDLRLCIVPEEIILEIGRVLSRKDCSSDVGQVPLNLLKRRFLTFFHCCFVSGISIIFPTSSLSKLKIFYLID